MIIAISDVHLGYEKSDKDNFKRFIDNYVSEELNKADHFVLLGDIFDFWRRKNIDTVLKNEEILTKLLNLDANVHYIVGNHDYYMLKLNERFSHRAFDVSKNLRLKDDDGNKYFFTHGYEIDVLANYGSLTIEDYEKICALLCRTETIVGKTISKIWRWRLIKPAEKRKGVDKIADFADSLIKNFFIGLEKDEKLIFGHTHRPFPLNKGGVVNTDVVNTGSWVNEVPEHKNTYVEIKDGKMYLKTF